MRYRLWDKNNKEIITSTNMEDFTFVTLDGDLVTISMDIITGTFSECDVSDDYILMESTTLLDNDYVEIYEGDIVKFNELELEIVKDIFGWYGRYWIKVGTTLKPEEIPLKDFWFNCKVIGHIYDGRIDNENN